MTKMKYLSMTLAIVGMLAPSIQSNVYAQRSNAIAQQGKDREIPVQPQILGGQFDCDADFISALDDGILVPTGTVVSSVMQ